MNGPDLNWLDRAVSWFSPKIGFERARARLATEILSAYEGAKTGRRTEGWITSGSDANTAIGMDLPRLRDRSRDLIRNTPEGQRMKRVITTSTVGTGIIPEAETGDAKLDKEINLARDQHFKECDADGQLDYFGQQFLEVASIFESGEVLVRRRPRRVSDGLSVPLQYQILESDHIDSNAYWNNSGGITVQGIERDAVGQRTGYWLFPRHPGAVGTATYNFASIQPKFYPASEIIHAYSKEAGRPGQERGVPWVHSLIGLMRDMDEYNDAEIVRAKIAACLALFIEQTADGTDGTIADADTETSTGDRIERIRPGMILYGKAGQKAQPIVPTGHANFAEFQKFQQHRMAYGVGMFYAQLTGDLGAVNWSSFRAGDRDFRGIIESFRWQCVIPMLLEPKWKWFIDAAYLAGKISRIDYGVNWTPPSFMSVNPLADAQADEADMANLTLDFGEANRRRGIDPAKRIASIKKWKKELDDAGIVPAWDRSKVNARGMAQPDASVLEPPVSPPK